MPATSIFDVTELTLSGIYSRVHIPIWFLYDFRPCYRHYTSTTLQYIFLHPRQIFYLSQTLCLMDFLFNEAKSCLAFKLERQIRDFLGGNFFRKFTANLLWEKPGQNATVKGYKSVVHFYKLTLIVGLHTDLDCNTEICK